MASGTATGAATAVAAGAAELVADPLFGSLVMAGLGGVHGTEPDASLRRLRAPG